MSAAGCSPEASTINGNFNVSGGSVTTGTMTVVGSGTTTITGGIFTSALNTGGGGLVLGSGVTASGLTVLNGDVTFNGATTGAALGRGGTLGIGTNVNFQCLPRHRRHADLTVSAPITSAATSGTQIITVQGNVGTDGNVLFSGIIGNGASGGQIGVTLNNPGGVDTFNGANTYSGNTTVDSGVTLKFGSSSFLCQRDYHQRPGGHRHVHRK